MLSVCCSDVVNWVSWLLFLFIVVEICCSVVMRCLIVVWCVFSVVMMGVSCLVSLLMFVNLSVR